MDTLAGIPFIPLTIDKDGHRVGPAIGFIPEDVTDLVVLAHGWKNDELVAGALYEGLLEHVRRAAGGSFDRDGHRFAGVGVYWPAFRFMADMTVVKDDLGSGDFGGAAANASSDLPTDDLRQIAGEIAAEIGEDAYTFAKAAVAAAGGGGAADALLATLRKRLSSADADARSEHKAFLQAPGADLIESLSHGGAVARTFVAEGEAVRQGAGAGLGSTLVERGYRLLSGGKSAVATVLNQATYYEMKARAGTVGVSLGAMIDGYAREGLRIHLVGHSFGARLVTSACAAMRTPVRSLSLLQGAFSHNGFGTGIGPRRIDGGFRKVVAERRVSGPILITHTRRDTAVGFFYAIASAASGETAKGRVLERLVGGPDDVHGGLGANGAQAMGEGEAVTLRTTLGSPPALSPGIVNNVLADAVVTNHNDVANAGVGELVWRAMSA